MRRYNPPNPTDNDTTSFDPVFLIERGNALSSSENHWAASDFFSLATVVLQNRVAAIETAFLLTNDDNEGDRKQKDERRKVAALYRTQSVEYLRKGRKSLCFTNHVLTYIILCMARNLGLELDQIRSA